MKRILGMAVLCAVCGVSTSALAQSAPPIGFWSTPDGGEKLLVGADAQCSFAAAGAQTWGGPCTWDATYSGGILSISYETVMGPAQVRFNVTWTSQTSISVNGDPFTRLQ